MIVMPIDEFIFEVKEELACFEEIGKDGAEKWARDFLANYKPKGDIKIDDESVIFEIADEYIDAVEQNKLASYWKNLKI